MQKFGMSWLKLNEMQNNLRLFFFAKNTQPIMILFKSTLEGGMSMAQKYVVKKPLKQRISNWVDEHSLAFGLGTITVLCVGVGAVWGYMIGDANGYTKGLVEFRDWHTDIAKTILDEAAHEGAYLHALFVFIKATPHKDRLTSLY